MFAPRARPESVVFAARTHGLTGLVIFMSVGILHLTMLNFPDFSFGRRAYVITFGLGLLYLFTGVAVWRGWRVGLPLHTVCTILFLPRPAIGQQLWRLRKNDAFRAHFAHKTSDVPPAS